MELYDIRVNHLKDNLLVTPNSLSFEWKIRDDSGKIDIKQKAFRICVYDNENNLTADTGMVMSDMLSANYIEEENFLRDLVSDSAYTAGIAVLASYRENSETEYTEKWLYGECSFETGLLHREDWKAQFIGETQDHIYHLYRKVFKSRKPVQAKLYILCAGAFYCSLNGKTVSNNFMDPAWSAYDKSIYYTAFDVTQLINIGENTLMVTLGDSMYNVPGGRYVYYERSYGKAGFASMLRLRYRDGSVSWINTDETWKRTLSPVTFSCLYGGEDYDARIARAVKEPDAFRETVVIRSYPKAVFRETQIMPLKVMESIAPVSVTEQDDSKFLYDFGFNLSGRVRIRIHPEKKSSGRKIILRPAEKLGNDGRISQKGTGEGYAWTYLCEGEPEEEYAPLFTYTGFRYVEAEGIQPEEADLTAEFIYPDCEEGDLFESSDEKLNSIYQLIRKAILSNTKSYFTDCPTREKLPWLEETHLVGPAIMDVLDVRNLYSKVLQDMADAQHANGLVPDISPEYVTGFEKWNPGYLDSPEWGSAAVLVPWECWERYGDLRILEDHYETMQRYTDYLTKRTRGHILSHGLGDWLDEGPCKPFSQNTPVAVSATSMYAMDLLVMAETADLLGKEEDCYRYRALHSAVRDSFDFLFLDEATGHIANGSQACQAMSLCAGLVPFEYKDKVMEQLLKDIRSRRGAITAGDAGHAYVVKALLSGRKTEAIWKMLEQDDAPGYAWQVKMGATTLTEEWDGPDPGRIHGSQNHLMLGAGMEWLVSGLGGCSMMNREGLPYGTVRIAPLVPPELSRVKVCQNHPFGKIIVEWEQTEDSVKLISIIPPGMTAVICDLNGKEIKTVGSGTWTTCLRKQ